jgi:hypothetical protein
MEQWDRWQREWFLCKFQWFWRRVQYKSILLEFRYEHLYYYQCQPDKLCMEHILCAAYLPSYHTYLFICQLACDK